MQSNYKPIIRLIYFPTCDQIRAQFNYQRVKTLTKVTTRTRLYTEKLPRPAAFPPQMSSYFAAEILKCISSVTLVATAYESYGT